MIDDDRLHRINGQIPRIRATICRAEACLRTAGVCVPIRYSYESRVINRMNRTPDRDGFAITTVNVARPCWCWECDTRVWARGTHTRRETANATSIKAEAKSLHVRCIYIWGNDDLSLLVYDRIYGNTWQRPLDTSCTDNSKCKWRANVRLIILTCQVVIPTSAW